MGRRGAERDHRRDGEVNERRVMMPVSNFGVGEIRLSERFTTVEKMLRIKKLVLDSVWGECRGRRHTVTSGVKRALVARSRD